MTVEGLDALVAEAMGRKLITSPLREEASPLREEKEDGPDPVPKEEPAPEVTVADIDTTKAPSVSIAFAVNGVRCILTIHVQKDATVTTPSAPRRSPQGGVKVKGVRGATTEEETPPEPPSHPLDGLDAELAPAIPVRWDCPVHGTHEVKTSRLTGRIFLVCGTPGCDEVGPR